MLEIAYAAFCGVSYVLIRGPRLHHPAVQHTRFLQFARAIQEVLATGSYMQVKIWFPMIDHPENEFVGMGDLAPFARPEYVQSFEGGDALGLDLYGAWDAWNIIRTFCKYHARLCVGKKSFRLIAAIDIKDLQRLHVIDALTICILLTRRTYSTDTSQTFTTGRHPNEMVLRTYQAAYNR